MATNVPPLMVVAPVKVPAPESVQVPVPFMVSVAPVPLMPARPLAALVPSRVKPKPAPVMVPALLRTRLPLFATMPLAEPSVSRPL